MPTEADLPSPPSGASAMRGRDRRQLRGLAHALKPIVHVGRQGLSEPVLREIEKALVSHELIKVEFGGARDERKAAAADIELRLGAACAGIVGHQMIFYRQHPDPKERRIALSR